MTDATLLDYIRKTRAQGFTDSQIRQALSETGWTEAEIQEGLSDLQVPIAASVKPKKLFGFIPAGFFSKRGKSLMIALIILVALPVLGYGGFAAYKKLANPKHNNPAPAAQNSTDADLSNANKDKTPAAKDRESRDRQRVSNVGILQSALAKFYENKKEYPAKLEELKTENLVADLPVDPKTHKSYLYAGIEEPPLHYSLSFMLEGPLGGLKSGITVVTDENRLPAADIENREQLILGERTQILSQELVITDLSKTNFHPQEEVVINVQPIPGVDFVSTHLLVGDLFLSDRTLPFQFSFSAPKDPGDYEVKVFGFDDKGNSYYQKTILSIR